MNPLRKAIASERTAFLFLLKLLILLCLVKSIFFIYNYKNNNGWQIHSGAEVLNIVAWSLYYDIVTLALISLPFFFVALLPVKKWLIVPAAGFSIFLSVAALLLNAFDIFYFRFHRQRADADLLYVLRNPENYGHYSVWLIIAAIVLFCLLAGWYLWKQYKLLIREQLTGIRFITCFALLLLIAGSLFTGRSKKIIPARPLTDLASEQLPLSQNSFHTFLYSLYRSRESVIPSRIYFSEEQQNALFSMYTKNNNSISGAKNIVLFIMESVPYEFFDSSSIYKPVLPFLDSLRNHATYFGNAFSYSYNSNKGITAILTGIPTITDIPLYHSGFSSIRKTAIGNVLANKGYSSSFFIGDNYDDFGFAKCCNWTGIQHYNSMENIPGYKKMQQHSMGLHDEYVLHFMQEKLREISPPFFSVFYNISTHYPNDLTEEYSKKLGNMKGTAAMKSMMYYDNCLAHFFKEAVKEKWFSNTVFIFCSDHWASPDADNSKNDMVNSFRIPVMIYDPSVNIKKTETAMVSQLDIMNTVLAYANYRDSITGYGMSLLDNISSDRIVYTKLNNSVYQAISNEYVLGFDADEGRRLYCYRYQADKKRTGNILPGQNAAADLLELRIKAFLQTAYRHYNK